MGNSGSEYGFVFPGSHSEAEATAQLEQAFTVCGLIRTTSDYPYPLSFQDQSGVVRNFQFLPYNSRHSWTCRVLWTHSRHARFRSFELGFYPDDEDFTQSEYDLVKRVFDMTSSTECFGFHASQDNAVDTEDSNLDFFFLKQGPQLVLAHLDEHREMSAAEADFITDNHAEYVRYLPWDDSLHSELFTRFSDQHRDRITRCYNGANRLIEKPWREYYQA